jgi:type II secretory pathway pseudopilin PulG
VAPVMPVVVMVVMMVIVVVVVIVVIVVVPMPVSAADLCQLGRSQRLQLLLGQGQFLRFPCPH